VTKYTILPPDQTDAVNARAADLHAACYVQARKQGLSEQKAMQEADSAVLQWRRGEVARRLAALNGGAQ
jgi:hypothetical protein